MKELILGSLILLLSGGVSAQPAQGDGSKRAEHEATGQKHQAYEKSQRDANQPKKEKPAKPPKPAKAAKPPKAPS